jgi:DNA-directed RNA polymerase specialized sigma24 family protein
VIVLRYFDGLAEAEIAVLLDCSLGTVRSQVSRGLARMRQVIGEGVSERQGGAPR